MDPLEERLEVEPAAGGDHDLAVEDAAGRELLPQGSGQLREVSGERPLVAAAQLDLVAVAEDDAAEPVPFRLVQHPALRRELPGELGQHGGDGGHHRQVHEGSLPYPGAMQSPSVRERVLEGGLVSIGRYGLARTTVDDVAQASGRLPGHHLPPLPRRTGPDRQGHRRLGDGPLLPEPRRGGGRRPRPLRAPRGRPRLRPPGPGRAHRLPAGGGDRARAAPAAPDRASRSGSCR